MRTLILLLLITASAQGQFMPFAMWRTAASAPAANVLPVQDSLVVHLQADSLGVAKADGDTTYIWKQSTLTSAGNAFQLTGANKPVYKTGILNGKPVVRFDGTDDYIRADNASRTKWNTVFFVAIPRATPSSKYVVVWNSSEAIIMGFSAGIAEFYDYPRLSIGAATNNVPALYCVVDSSSNMRSTYRNGANVGSNTLGTYGYFTTVDIGAAGGSYAFNGDVAELIVYSRALTATERQSVETYINTKYAIW